VDPAQSLFDYLQRSVFFTELHPHNAWSLVQQGRPFAILILCRCSYDSNLDINGLENLMVDAGLHHKFSLIWAQNPVVSQFQMANTYGLEPGRPAFVIDNIPVGQHVEKYLFPGRIEHPHTATAQDMFQFLADFHKAPTPLKLILRSQPVPEQPFHIDEDRGKIVDVVGSTFEAIVLQSPYTVLLMLHSPGCGGCQAALPEVQKVAESLSWSNRDVIVAKMDRTQNDVPLVLRFTSYPAIFLYKAGVKFYDTASEGGEEPMQRGALGSRGYRSPVDYHGPTENPRQGDQCNSPLNAADLEAWVKKHTGGGNLLGMEGGIGGKKEAQSQWDGASTPVAEPPRDHQEAQSAQQAGAAM
jgi:thiol-disulfide isomerase/thioredoxin